VTHRAAHHAAQALRRVLMTVGADAAIPSLSRRMPADWLWTRLRPDIDMYPRPTIRRIRRDGIRLDVDLSDYVQWLVYYSVETNLRHTLYALARPGDVILDVGSNIGEILLNFARLAGPGGRAIGFEANPETCARCRSNIRLNEFANVEVHAIGVGSDEGELHFGHRSSSNSGADSIMPAGDGTIKVPVTTIDRFAGGHGLDRVDLIKIDVEGYEMNVLRGAEATLGKHRPRMFIELCDNNLRDQHSSAAELVGFLEGLRYDVRNAESGAPVASSDDFGNCFLDIVCRPAT
jgi:FkbM family methyltransferase